MTPFEKPFIENLFINIIKGIIWIWMGCSQHSIINHSFMTPFEKPFVENLFINIIKGIIWISMDVLNIQLSILKYSFMTPFGNLLLRTFL
jgi:hypothetical protein